MRYATLAQAEDHIAMLEAQIEASGIEPVKIPEWGSAFSLRQIILIQALERAYPNWMTFEQLDQIIPKQDRNGERGLAVIRMMVHYIRAKAGRGVILAERGFGYKLAPEFHRRIVKGV
jgi:hypothetical protein